MVCSKYMPFRILPILDQGIVKLCLRILLSGQRLYIAVLMLVCRHFSSVVDLISILQI